MSNGIVVDLFKEITYNTNYFVSKRYLFPYIIQIGSGGNGTYVLQQVAQMLNIFDLPHFYLLCDPDVVETKNLSNQLFLPKDVGSKKADVLAKRYSSHYGLEIASYSRNFVEDVGMLSDLFNDKERTPHHYNDIVFLPILISAVDNNYSRRIFHEYFMNVAENLLYLDVGIYGAKAPYGKDREQWTKEEDEKYRASGYNGQVVCGLKLKNEVIIPPAASIFPDILDDTDEIKPSEISCSTIVVSEPQRVITNRFAAMTTCMFLNEILESGTISNHYTLFHAKKGLMRSFPISI